MMMDERIRMWSSLLGSLKELKKRFTSSTPAAGEALLADVGDKFYVNNGPAVGNMKELIYALRDMTEEQFSYHVNSGKNDFASWIHDCIGDISLSEAIRKIDDKNNMAIMVAKRYTFLKGDGENE